MMTTNQGVESRPGCLGNLVNTISSIYLVSMLFYFVIRLLTGDSIWWAAFLNAFAIYTFSPLLVLIPLAVFANVWRTAIRLGLLALLAILWFGPFFQPKSVPPPTGTTFEVVTFNLWGDNVDTETALPWLQATDADLIVLQEAPAEIAEQFNSTLYPDNSRYHTGGMSLLSRFPVSDYTAINNNIQRAVIDVDGRQIAVYHVHLPYPINRPPRIDFPGLRTLSRYDETDRNAQIDLLLDLLADEPLPHIVAGDFNLSQHSIKYSALAVNMTDAFRATNSGLGVTWSTQMPVVLLRLDYVWVSKNLNAIQTEVGPGMGSDHYPVVAEIEIPPLSTLAPE